MRRNLICFGTLFIGVLVLFVWTLVSGPVDVSLHDLAVAVFNPDKAEPFHTKIFWELRFPRAMAALLAGASLSVSGLCLQTVFRNPLCGPYVLGISSGASLGVALALLAGFGFGAFGVLGAASLGAILVTQVVLVLASRFKNASVLLVAGLLVGYFVNALVNVLIAGANAESLQAYVSWGLGGFTRLTFGAIPGFMAASIVGLALIMIIMLVVYRVMGVVADIALALYVLLYLWVMIAFHAVLTLPGIAGIILSIGMAVDSNVIIFSRIREEIGLGKSVRVAVQSGFKRAMGTIIDSQVTTIIAAVILYLLGTGSVRGFALTLLIGIVLSVFTAVVISQILLQALAESKFASPKNFGIKEQKDTSKEEKTGYPFMAKRKIFYLVSITLLVLGLSLGAFALADGPEGAERHPVWSGRCTDIRDGIQFAGENNEKIILKTTEVMDNAERQELCDKLQSAFGIAASNEFVEQAGLIGPSVGSQLKSNALKAVVIASICMLVYIAIRFEWRFGIGAIVALLHDALMLFAFYGLFHIQMNSPFIAGLLIVIGYSINDTIVIFDRIREGLKTSKRKQEYVIDSSITACISRSIMTSVTTMVAILPLIILCGESIRAFALPLIAGVLVGTYSSIGIASGAYYDLCLLTKKNKYKGA